MTRKIEILRRVRNSLPFVLSLAFSIALLTSCTQKADVVPAGTERYKLNCHKGFPINFTDSGAGLDRDVLLCAGYAITWTHVDDTGATIEKVNFTVDFTGDGDPFCKPTHTIPADKGQATSCNAALPAGGPKFASYKYSIKVDNLPNPVVFNNVHIIVLGK